jgi:hypothetical protein
VLLVDSCADLSGGGIAAVLQLWAPWAPPFVAVAAPVVTARFAKHQRDIASAQRDIARNQLKLDLFEKRYALYSELCTTMQVLSRATAHKDCFDANASFEVIAREFHATKKVGWSDHARSNDRITMTYVAAALKRPA